jgi:D-beta-D-heptose 7-phosphate kinase/D-beta-D-heptose 1-phosphate adenosyltransferase
VTEHRPLANLAAGFAGTAVLVVGDVMCDEYVWGDVRRISPEAPVPVVSVRERTYRPGGAANVAAGITALGGVADLAGVIGDDDAGLRLAAELGERGVDPSGLLVDTSRPTTTKTRILAGAQQVVRADVETGRPLRPATETALLEWVTPRLGEVQAVVVSDYAKGVVTPDVGKHIMTAGAAAGRPVVVDPKGRDLSRFRGATVVTPNLHEAERAAGVEVHDEAGVIEAGWRLVDMIEGAVLLTRGGRGMTLFDPAQPSKPIDIPARTREVFDVTGAGDTVVATVALAVASGLSLEVAARLATMAAGVVIGKLGTSVATVGDLAQFEQSQ